MSKNLSNLVILKTENEYRDLYKREFLDVEIYTHDGKIIEFKSGHFDHIFYRNKKTCPQFDRSLAQKMLQLKDIIEFQVSSIEIYENYNFESKRNERVYVYVYGKRCIFLWVNDKNGNYFPITAYRKNTNDLEKFRKWKNNKIIKQQ